MPHPLRMLVIAILVLHGLLLACAAVVNSPVLDEIPHLAAGIAHWKTGSLEPYRVNPPLVRSLAALPVLIAGANTEDLLAWRSQPFDRPEFSLGRTFVESNGSDSFRLFTLARWACLPLVLLGGYVCFRWSRALYGVAGGLSSLALWCCCPNLLGWGATICPDAAAAALGLLACYTFWLWIRDPSWRRTAACGACLGLALLTKSTWLVLFGVWPMIWIAGRIAAGKRSRVCRVRETHQISEIEPQLLCLAGPRQTLRPFAAGPKLLVILLLGVYSLNLGYGFSGSFRRLADYEFISRALTGHATLGQTGNRFRDTAVGQLPVPLPADFFIGLDVQRYDFEKGKWSYLRGEQKQGGWWHYYVYAIGVKTPLGSLLLIAASFVVPRLLKQRTTTLVDDLAVLAPAVAVLLVVSSQTGFNRYLRYVLPALPFLYVWAGRAACIFDASVPSNLLRGVVRALVIGCLAGSTVGGLWYWPYSLSYFNELVGGPRNGHLHLLDANIDWGQDLLHLKRWLSAHPEVGPLRLAYFGWIDPRLAGVEWVPVPGVQFNERGELTAGNPEQIVPGWYAASVNHVLGYRHTDNAPNFAWLQEFQPVDRVGYSIWVYRLSETDVAGFLARHGKP